MKIVLGIEQISNPDYYNVNSYPKSGVYEVEEETNNYFFIDREGGYVYNISKNAIKNLAVLEGKREDKEVSQTFNVDDVIKIIAVTQNPELILKLREADEHNK